MDDSNACHHVMAADLRHGATVLPHPSQGSVPTGTITNGSAPLQIGDASSVSAWRIAYEMAGKARRRMGTKVAMDQPSTANHDIHTITSRQAARVGLNVTGALMVNSASQLDTFIGPIHLDDEQHRRKGDEEWEKSFVGSSSDIPFQRPPLQQMDAMIDQFGRSLPSASSLLCMLLENQEKDDIFGDKEQGEDSSSTSSTLLADDMQAYFLMEED
jgi:hypothetical protein